MIVTFLRHGSTAWNEQGRMQGRRDVPLSARGRAEVGAWRVPGQPAGRMQWVASPLQRAAETAQLLSGFKPRYQRALIEINWGAWEGFRIDELRARVGAELARVEARGLDFRPPGGESPREVLHRVQRWLAGVAAVENSLVAVSHNGVLRAVLAAHRLGQDLQAPDPAATRHYAPVCGRARRGDFAGRMQSAAGGCDQLAVEHAARDLHRCFAGKV